MGNKIKFVCGVGINDADYKVQIKEEAGYVDGIRKRKVVWICPYYSRWKGMLGRCYSESSLKRAPTYTDCSVCEEWLTFSNFKRWMEKQDWEGRQLDKDLLGNGKLYSPNTCCFISGKVNKFLLEKGDAFKGPYPTGVVWDADRQKLTAYCNNPFTGKVVRIGRYSCPNEAHLAWISKKLEFARILAAEEQDTRVAKALIERYEKYGQNS